MTKLGFKGAMIMGLTHGRFMDDKQFRPIFERAVALDVPVYIHPTPPHPAVTEAYFKEYPVLAVAPLGFTLETLTHTFRLIVSGLFDALPTLKIIVGHLGETAPFLLWRTNDIARRAHDDAARRSPTITASISGSPPAARFPIPR